MDSTQGNSRNYRTTARWNSVPVPAVVARRAITNMDEREDGCWISRYSMGSHGYAQIGWSLTPNSDGTGRKNEMVLAHRAAWVAANGQVPMGMTLDHMCKTRQCVNPSHLRLLSNIENARRNQGDDFPMGGCRNGHPNTSLVPLARKTKAGERRYGLTCGECMKASRARWIAANPEQHRAAVKKKNDRRKVA